jgi:phenylalanyl-tRNA synthetase beta chain
MHPKGIEYGSILANAPRYPALKDNIGILSLIPITNAERGRVTTKTTDLMVVVDGTQNDPINKTADMLASTFMDLGADIKPIQINYPNRSEITPRMTSRSITMPLTLAEGEIGVEIGYNNVISLANKMGYEAALLDKNIRFRIPEYRMDIINEQDVVEDIAIGYGYDFIQPVPLFSRQKGEFQEESIFFDDISDAMVGMRFSEMMNTYLTNEKTDFSDMGIKDPAKHLSMHGLDYIRLKNPRAQSISMMRTWLLPSLLRNIGNSKHEKMPQRLFELDMVFYLSKGAPQEDYHLAAVITDPRSNFNEIKGTVESLAYFLKLEIKIARYDHPSFVPGRCASVNIGNKMLGFFGEIHPEALNSFGIEEPTSALEINMMLLLPED